MKRILILFIISLSMGTILNSCSQNKKRSQDSIPVANEKTKTEYQEQQQKKMEDETFTTSKGEYLTQKVILHFYNKGVEDGVRDKRGSKERNRNYYHFDGNGTEEQGKAFFVSWFGIPSDENAKEVSNQAIQKYISGYEDGWNY